MSIGDSKGDGSREHHFGLPIWKDEPRPLQGWSSSEQEALATALQSLPPHARNDPDSRHAAYALVLAPGRPLHGRRTPRECEDFFFLHQCALAACVIPCAPFAAAPPATPAAPARAAKRGAARPPLPPTPRR
jgi:hypothetical protein